MIVSRKKEIDFIVSRPWFNTLDRDNLLRNILIVNLLMWMMANLVVLSIPEVHASAIEGTSFNSYQTALLDYKSENFPKVIDNPEFNEEDVLQKEDFETKTVYHTDSNVHMYSGWYTGYSIPGNRIWNHAYDLSRKGLIHGATAGRWCTFFAQMWFYDVFGFNSSGNGGTGNGNEFASTVYNRAVYYDEEGNLKHYFRYTDHPEPLTIVSVYSSLSEGHVLCIDEVDYENGTITISEGNANGNGDARMREVMSLERFYALNPGYKVYVTPTEELLKMISE